MYEKRIEEPSDAMITLLMLIYKILIFYLQIVLDYPQM